MSIDPAPVLVFGMDGADYDVVSEMIAANRLPTLRRLRDHGVYGPLKSTEPPVTPVAWSTFLTGLQPGRHGIYNFSQNPFRGGFRVESAAARGGTPLWRMLDAAGRRSSFVLVPFTYPLESLNGTMVSGYGGPERPDVTPPQAAERIARKFPNLVSVRHPMRERYWEDFDRFRRLLIADVEEVEALSIDVIEADRPDLFAVDFMSSDTIGHLAYHLRNSDHPAHDPSRAADHIGEVYTAVDAAIGRVIEAAERIHNRPVTAIVLSDHGMKPIHYTFQINQWLEDRGYLRYRKRSAQRISGLARIDSKLALRASWYPRLYDAVIPFGKAPADVNRTMRDVDRWHTDAYAYGTYGPVFFGEKTGRRTDTAFQERLIADLRTERSPLDGEPIFEVRRGSDVYSGAFAAKAPDLVVTSRDPRILISASRRRFESPWMIHDRLDPELSENYGFSGHHGPIGVLSAAGPAVAHGRLESPSIVDLAPTILALLGVDAGEQLDGSVLPLFTPADELVAATTGERPVAEESVYSENEEAEIQERLRALGYE
jgi:predicted AlkP superfamily phosphohydrolase/phosphomutase